MVAALTACEHAKTKPVSTDITKTMIQVAGKKDSVINNPQKNYGTATVAEPCVKCLLQVIQASKSYKQSTESVSSQNIAYTVNWIRASAPAESANKSNMTDGLRIDVRKNEDGEEHNLCSYAYNNQSGTLYLLNNEGKNQQPISSITPDILKKIRNSCYWGVASSR
ncbi:hypothetical protein [Mucilaginibacter lappiensis]|uniref:Uncharacterized protein n=1 Tax=Mucilaginibacter lappiensis TaxID=354630 RepID=A0A841J9Z8_9SPHI|nr:hypothetical protein [Mucilaginibacter lappiensis]MBB6107309.1 hypothetical protein [Mucilaginibacter lappiensis]MBB6126416.1 hypothetical protein [Mucilaginibacter lappiensis]